MENGENTEKQHSPSIGRTTGTGLPRKPRCHKPASGQSFSVVLTHSSSSSSSSACSTRAVSQNQKKSLRRVSTSKASDQ
ncbi:hypothetical protein TYRP_007588 [Tyrophagus putrescentiae]|nr:hypothetical protein TYRP_007588 [Tyrophagus putrescentiae]